jgi:hypothetical protein
MQDCDGAGETREAGFVDLGLVEDLAHVERREGEDRGGDQREQPGVAWAQPSRAGERERRDRRDRNERPRFDVDAQRPQLLARLARPAFALRLFRVRAFASFARLRV